MTDFPLTTGALVALIIGLLLAWLIDQFAGLRASFRQSLDDGPDDVSDMDHDNAGAA